MKYIYIVIIFVLFILILVSGACATVKENLSQIDESNAASLGLDTKFHDSIEDIKAQSNAYIPILNKVKVTNNEGEEVEINIPKNLGGFNYYEPGAYKYSSASYVPDYEDGVALSKSIGLVPRLKGEFFVPVDTHVFNSNETNYDSANSVLTSSNWSVLTPSGPNVPGKLVNDVKYATTDNRRAQLQATYPIDKTDEELEYENKVADLLNAQTNIRNYATPQNLNIQKTIRRATTTAPKGITLPSDLNPDIDLKNELNILYNRPTLTPERVAYTTPTKAVTTPLNEMQRLASLAKVTQRSNKKYAYDNESRVTMSRDDLLKYSDQ
jgi:hypothetical protein